MFSVGDPMQGEKEESLGNGSHGGNGEITKDWSVSCAEGGHRMSERQETEVLV